jgi:hypothetical protein
LWKSLLELTVRKHIYRGCREAISEVNINEEAVVKVNINAEAAEEVNINAEVDNNA